MRYFRFLRCTFTRDISHGDALFLDLSSFVNVYKVLLEIFHNSLFIKNQSHTHSNQSHIFPTH